MRALKKKKKERKGTKVTDILRVVFEAGTKLAERVVISHHLENCKKRNLDPTEDIIC